VAVIAGEDELSANEVQVKDLGSQASTRHPLAEVVPAVSAALQALVKGR